MATPMTRVTTALLLLWSATCLGELNTHFKFITPVGVFMVPAAFAPIPKWQEMIIPDIEGDNFVFAIPADELAKVSLQSDSDLIVTFISRPEPHMRPGARCKARPKPLGLPDLCMKRIPYRRSQVKYFYPADFTTAHRKKMDLYIRYLLDEWRHVALSH